MDGVTARVVVAHPEDALISQVDVEGLGWIRLPDKGEQVTVKVRYQMKPAQCDVKIDGDCVHLVFDEAQKPTAPGQVAAFYAGDELLGGGIVSHSL